MSATADFPAAHSMDTTWFAVDEDGHVGVFHTGEEGGLPLTAANSNRDGLMEALRQVRAAEYLVRDPAARTRFEEAAELFALQPMPTRVYVVVAPEPQDVQGYRQGTPDAGSLEAMFPYLGWAVVREGLPRVLLSAEEALPEDIEAMRAHPHVRALAFGEDLDIVMGDDDGLFQFEAEWASSLYTRQGKTDDRLKVNALPPALQAAASELRIPVRFGDREQVDIADYVAHDEILTYGGDTLAERIRRIENPHWHEKPRSAQLAKLLAYALIGLTVVALVWLLAHRR